MASVTVAVAPLNFTTLSEAVVLKFVPVTITVSPTIPIEGENSVMVTTLGVSTSSLQDDRINAKQTINAFGCVCKTFLIMV